MPKRIQRKRTAGWRMPENAVYVGRPTRWGNPFQPYSQAIVVPSEVRSVVTSPLFPDLKTARIEIASCGSVECCLAWYRIWAEGMRDMYYRHNNDFLAPLKGKDLVCWCRPEWGCHADILLELANL